MEGLVESLKSQDATKTALMEEIALMEDKISKLTVEEEITALTKLMEEKKDEVEKVQGVMRDIGDAIKVVKAEESSTTLEPPAPVTKPVEPVVAEKAPEKSPKSSGKVVSRKPKAASKKSDKKASSTKVAVSSSNSTAKAAMEKAQEYGMQAAQLGLQHRSFFFFSVCAAGIFFFGDYASI